MDPLAFTLALTLGLARLPGDLAAFPPAGGRQQVVVSRVLDGDTVEVYLLVPVSVRVRGINAPEKNTPAGPASKAALERHLPPGSRATLWLHGRDKYGRQLGDLVGRDGLWASWLQVLGGHAQPWDGRGTRP